MGKLIYLEKKKHDDFESFKFLVDAAESNEDKVAFNYIYVGIKNIYSTDSRRLHIIINDNRLEKGYYKVLKRQSTKILLHKADASEIEYITFPNYKAVIPKDYRKWDNISFKNSNYSISSSSINIIKLIRNTPGHKGLNIDYLKDLIEGDWTVYFNELLDPFVFEDISKKHTALIMPVKMNEEMEIKI